MNINGTEVPGPRKTAPLENAPYWYLLGYGGGPQKDYWKGDELYLCRLHQNRVFTTKREAALVDALFKNILARG